MVILMDMQIIATKRFGGFADQISSTNGKHLYIIG
jgi:hypothetical protein